MFGDNGKLYAPSFEPFIKVYRDDIMPLADLLTPNQTEASLLLDMQIASLSEAHAACVKFHALGIRYVVITSLEVAQQADKIWLVFSDGERPKRYGYVEVDKIKGYWVGTGDLTTALLFAWIQRDPEDLAAAVQNTFRCALTFVLVMRVVVFVHVQSEHVERDYREDEAVGQQGTDLGGPGIYARHPASDSTAQSDHGLSIIFLIRKQMFHSITPACTCSSPNGGFQPCRTLLCGISNKR